MRRFILAATAAALVVAPAGLAAAEASAATGGAGAAHVAAVNWPTVRPGARGENVRTIQYLLNARGIGVTVDGAYGNTTTNGVKVFQDSRRLPADGRVGAVTWPKLVVFLKRGSRGIAVTALERQLRFKYGYRAVIVDRDFGPKTDAALKDFQRRRGIRADGVSGVDTWKALVAG
jgi:peptidoglycan hydrolase-like protein with peptidoglycan-binding domain